MSIDLAGSRVHRAPTGGAPAVPSAEVLADALGVAWAGFTLYEHPERNEAFSRAIGVLGRCPAYPWRIEATPEGFVDRGIKIEHRREATLRVARRIFALGTAAVELTSPPSAGDVIGLFELLASSDPPQDPAASLRRRGVTTITLLHRELIGSSDEASDERVDGSPWYLAYDGDPEPFVHRLLEGDADRPGTVGRRFIDEYHRVMGLVDADDTWAKEEVVHAFTDAFWHLPKRHRAAVLAGMLEREDSPESTVFLDQFGSLELAELNRMFGAAGHPLLAEYARVAAEQGGRERADVAILDPARSPADALGKAVIGHIAHVLEAIEPSGTPAVEAALRRLRTRLPRAEDATQSSTNAMRALLDLNLRAGTPEGPAEIWAAKVVTALGDGNLAAADRWLSAVGGLDVTADQRRMLLRALASRLDDTAVERLIAVLSADPKPGPGSVLRKAAPHFAAERLVAELGAEEQMARRRVIIKALIHLAAANPDALVPHLRDPRWYVVRNVALILGASGRTEAAPPLQSVLDHDDPRVRVEGLVGVRKLLDARSAPFLLSAVNDPDDTVAARASMLLGQLHDPGVDVQLVRRLERDSDRQRLLRTIAALAERKTDAARRALEERAGGWFPFWGTARVVRRAARAALEGSHE